MQVDVFFNILEFTIDTITSAQPTFLPRHFGLYQRPSSEEACSEELVDSSSGSCHNSDATWQEIGRTCDSVYSCPCPGSRIVVTLFECVLPLRSRTEKWTKYYKDQRQYTFENRDDDLWTGTRATTCWATHTTDFLPRCICIMTRTGRTEQASSDEGLWQRLKYQGKNVGCVEVNSGNSVFCNN